MATQLKLSDGTLVNVPDGMTPEAMKNVAERGEQFIKTASTAKGYGNGAVDMASAGLTGVNRGIADTLGAPVDLLNWGMNGARSLVGLPKGPTPFMGSDYIKDRMSQGNMIQNTRGHDTIAQYGELLGNGVATAAGAGLAAPLAKAGGMTSAVLGALGPSQGATANAALRSTLGQQAVGAGLQQAGEAVGEATGGKWGGMLGGVLAPLAPTAALRAGEGALRWAGARPNGESGRAFDVLTENGITPTPGLVGNGTMARMENAATYLPGGAGDRNMVRTWEQFQDRLQQMRGEVAGNVDPNTGRPIPMTDMYGPTEIGADIQQVARAGHDTTKARIGNEYNQLRAEFGDQTLVPVHEAIPQIQGMGQTEVNGQVRPRTESGLQAGLDAEVNRVNDIRVPKSETAQSLINSEIAAREAMLERSMPGTVGAGRLEQEIADLRSRLEANRQAPAEALDDTITKIGYDTQGNSTLGTGQSTLVRRTLTDAREAAYRKKGGDQLGDRLKSLDEDYARLNDKETPLSQGGDLPFLKGVAEKNTGQDAYSVVADPKRPENAAVLQRNQTAPDQWRTIAADIMGEKSALPASKRGPVINSTPGNFAGWWGSLSPQGKILYANGSEQTLARLNSLYEAAQQYGMRSGTMNFSNTAPSAATATFMGSVLSHPLQTAKALGSSYLTGGLATSPRAAEIIANRNVSPLTERLFRPGVQATAREFEDKDHPSARLRARK